VCVCVNAELLLPGPGANRIKAMKFNLQSTYYVMKGLFDGVDGVVRGSAPACCNRNRDTLKSCSKKWRNANLLCICGRMPPCINPHIKQSLKPDIRTEVFHGFPQSIQESAGQDLHGYFLLQTFRFTIHYHPLF